MYFTVAALLSLVAITFAGLIDMPQRPSDLSLNPPSRKTTQLDFSQLSPLSSRGRSRTDFRPRRKCRSIRRCRSNQVVYRRWL
ncbi:uncharacterized protein L3040_003604 [Drepanopeziza brunnea f. sp. 'multigermtubi']|uniref:uncharacterized protein n=1 Tax=Drepanopeziza brunnea f. sp. 'multigermtubi' TaxID=698441 RepID=UPI0023A377C5|nr:hypothetical protein L3040_003604 [Drepanopeziza brunnea f. sp. 'multigermtubi']